jgi:hypothetical protein
MQQQNRKKSWQMNLERTIDAVWLKARMIFFHIKPLTTGQRYHDALNLLDELWNCKSGTMDYERFRVLAVLVDEYEREKFPIPPPDKEA